MSFQQRAYQFYLQKGYAPAQAAALAGNAMVESGGRTTVLGDAGKAYGTFQWHPDRQANLRAFAQREGLDPATETTQLAFKDWELNNTEKRAGAMLRAAQTPEAANAAVLASLRPAGYTRADPTQSMHYDKRLANTQGLLGSGGAVLAAAPSRSEPPAPTPGPASPAAPAAPVYGNDLGTYLRSFGNYLAPDLIDAPKPLTPEEIAAQKSQTAQISEMGQYAAAQKAFAQLAQQGAQAPQQMQMMAPAVGRPQQFRPIPRMKGLLG